MTFPKSWLLPSALAALIVAALALGACGDDDGGGTTSAAGNGTDLAFIEEMVPHHQSAIDMAKVAQERAQSQFIKDLADDIISAQQGEITILNAARHDIEQAGVKKTDLGIPEHMMGMDGDMTMLESADPFDKAFIDMMVPHHQGAIRMARVELTKGRSEALKRLADNVVDAQSREIKAMNDHRKTEFGAASPAGGVPAESGQSGSHEGMDLG